MVGRGGLWAVVVWLWASIAAQATPPNVITKAEFIEPTTRYDHGILGDAIEWGALKLTVDMGCHGCEQSSFREFTIRLPQNRVFEDLEPRIVNMGEAISAVVVVETDLDKGARLAIYYESGLLAATPFIGRTHRWLAPIGVADLNQDGYVEIAYIDRPHLAKTLRIWSFRGDDLVHLVDIEGLTNHRIGENWISGGIRDCGTGPELITANASWTQIMAMRLEGGTVKKQVLGPYKGRKSFRRALACKAL